MPAVVIINEKNGAGETATDKTSSTIRSKMADDAAVNTSNPMVAPASGSNWSFEKWLQLSVSGTFTELTNLNFYTDGSNDFGTGINSWAKTEVTYVTPAQLTASTGYLDTFSHTSGSPLSLGAGPFTTVGDIGSYLVLGLEVQSTAVQGALSAESLSFSFDEI